MFTLTSFSGVSLPGGTVLPIGPVPGVGGLLTVGNEAFDPHGTAQLLPTFPYTLTYRALVTAASASAMQTALAAQWVLSGMRGSLVRTMTDATTHTTTARLLRITADRSPSTKLQQELEYEFAILSPWLGTARSATYLNNQYTCNLNNVVGTPAVGDTFSTVAGDAGSVLSYAAPVLRYQMSSGSLSNGEHIAEDAPSHWNADVNSVPAAQASLVAPLLNSGNAPCRGITIVYSRLSAGTTTRLDVAITGSCYFIYSGNVDNGETVTINCGARTVTHSVDGNDYAHFAFDASSHKSEDWLLMGPSATTSVIWATTAGSASDTIQFSHNDTWL